METVGKQNTFAQHPLEPSHELDLRDCESMAEVERAVRVGEWEVAEPLGVLLSDLCF